MRLLWLDYRACLRERKTWLCWVLLAYAALAIPVMLARPPQHVQEAIATWFGQADPFQLFMYVWIDLTMNKVIAFLPVVLASGVVLRERDTGVLPLFASKPLSLPRFFAVRALGACAVMATLHLVTQLFGAFYFSLRIPGFRPGTFLVAMIPHLFAGVFATALSAAIGGWLKHRGASALVGICTLSLLVGIALVGYYQPAWRQALLLNPIALGSTALGDLNRLSVGLILPPVLTLSALSMGAIGLGALGLRRLEA
jgi:ABC-2 type transport system permease protein